MDLRPIPDLRPWVDVGPRLGLLVAYPLGVALCGPEERLEVVYSVVNVVGLVVLVGKDLRVLHRFLGGPAHLLEPPLALSSLPEEAVLLGGELELHQDLHELLQDEDSWEDGDCRILGIPGSEATAVFEQPCRGRAFLPLMAPACADGAVDPEGVLHDGVELLEPLPRCGVSVVSQLLGVPDLLEVEA